VYRYASDNGQYRASYLIGNRPLERLRGEFYDDNNNTVLKEIGYDLVGRIHLVKVGVQVRESSDCTKDGEFLGQLKKLTLCHKGFTSSTLAREEVAYCGQALTWSIHCVHPHTKRWEVP
jgi:hypothetical protein